MAPPQKRSRKSNGEINESENSNQLNTSNLRGQLEEFEKLTKILQWKNKDLNAQTEKNDQKIKELDQEIEENIEEFEELRKKLKLKDKELASQNEKNDKTMKQLKDEKIYCRDMKREFERKFDDMESKIEDLEKLNQSLLSKNEELTLKNDKSIEKMNYENIGFEKEKHILKNVNCDLQQKLHTIKQEQMQENFASKRKIEDLQTKIEELEKVNQRWQFVNESLTLQNEKNDEIIEKMNLEKNGWEKEMHILKNVNSDLEQKLDTIKQKQMQENFASKRKEKRKAYFEKCE